MHCTDYVCRNEYKRLRGVCGEVKRRYDEALAFEKIKKKNNNNKNNNQKKKKIRLPIRNQFRNIPGKTLASKFRNEFDFPIGYRSRISLLRGRLRMLHIRRGIISRGINHSVLVWQS